MEILSDFVNLVFEFLSSRFFSFFSLSPRMAADTCRNRNAKTFLEQIPGGPASFIPQSSL